MKSNRWYQSPYLLLPAVAIIVALWLLLRPAPAPVVIPSLVATGPNLLQNPSFLQGATGWIAYHNATPMAITYDRKRGGARIVLGAATTSVQELYQSIGAAGGAPLVASGTIGVSGAPLPAQTSVVVIFLDSTNRAQTKFGVTSANGMGDFPFKVAFVPDGQAKQFVVAIIAGASPGNKVVVTLKNLSVRTAAQEAAKK